MSSLVPYGGSDSESYSDEDDSGATAESQGGFKKHHGDTTDAKLVNKQDLETSKKAVQIEIPVLIDSDDDDEPAEKKQKITKATGLFAVLPAPKNIPISTKTFVPMAVVKKNKNIPAHKPVTKPKPQAKSENKKVIESDDSDEEENELEVSNNMIDDDLWTMICSRKKKPPAPVIEVTESYPQVIDSAPEAIEPYNGLDNEAFKKLVGSGSLNRENIRLIDVNEDEVLPDRDVWMTKALTDPECKPKYVSDEPVNDTCRKKHHITYLAQRAKENESELQNQWAQNKYSRKQTQQKYGF